MNGKHTLALLAIFGFVLAVSESLAAQQPSPRHPMPGPMQRKFPELQAEGQARDRAVSQKVPAAAAEIPGPPPVLWIEREQVKTGALEKHRKVVQDILAVYRRANWRLDVLGMTAMVGEENEALYLIGFDSFGAIDEFLEQFAKSAAIGAEVQKLELDERALHAAKRSMVAVYRPDLSYRPDVKSVAQARMLVVNESQVRFGEGANYEADIKFLISAFEKGNVDSHWFTYQVVAGAAPQTFVRIESLKRFGDWDAFGQQLGNLRSAIGDDGMQRLNQLLKNNTMQGSGSEETPLVRLYALDPSQSSVSDGFASAAPDFWRPKSKPASSKGKNPAAASPAPKPN